ncbi:MAG: hypothetical protein NC131_10445 [Roseburia sp.]|nr:hypothetical protein [Roseburia sp.]
MNDKITKVIIGGKEYFVTDKQAQQMLDVISGKIDTIENRIEEIDNRLTWRVVK